jgi:hypothetical protein
VWIGIAKENGEFKARVRQLTEFQLRLGLIHNIKSMFVWTYWLEITKEYVCKDPYTMRFQHRTI